MRKQQIAIIALFVWLTLVAVYVLLGQNVDLSLFFLVGFMGLLVIVQFLEPTYGQPGYLRYMRILIAVGIVISGVIVAQKVVMILAH
jgi:hypothetical protein